MTHSRTNAHHQPQGRGEEGNDRQSDLFNRLRTLSRHSGLWGCRTTPLRWTLFLTVPYHLSPIPFTPHSFTLSLSPFRSRSWTPRGVTDSSRGDSSWLYPSVSQDRRRSTWVVDTLDPVSRPWSTSEENRSRWAE